MLAIICATESEYLNIKRNFEIKYILFNDDQEYALCNLSDGDFIIMHSNPGFKNANKSIKYLLKTYEIRFVLSAGMAGGLNQSFDVGDIIVSDRIYLLQKKEKLFQINKSITKNIYTMATNSIGNQTIRGLLPKVHMGSVISVNEAIVNSEKANYLYKKYNGCCVETESGILAEACEIAGIAFAAIKIVSDFANESALETIYTNQFKVTSILGKVLNGMLPDFLDII